MEPELLTTKQAASVMNIGEERARAILLSRGVQPVSLPWGKERKTLRWSRRAVMTNAARDLAQFSARFGTPLTCASIVLAHCMQRARRKISRLSAFRLSELHAYSRYHFWASCSGTSPYSPLSDSKSQIPLFNFFARPI